MKDCPQACVFEAEQQPSPAIVPARNSNNGKGCQQIGQGGNKIGSCGGRGKGNAQPGREAASVDERAHCYAFPGKNEVEASDAVITCTIFFYDRMTNVLFDPGSTYFYVSISFASNFEMLFDVLDAHIHVSTPVGESVIVTDVYHAFLNLFMGLQTWGDLVILDIHDFDIILGMTWLSPNYVVLNCNTKSVTLEIPGKEKLEREGVERPRQAETISSIRASKLVDQGCLAYLAHVRDI
ncbi:uncharacterized protein [Solanum lycopersicum]|uniref:uncharacterized protein n=1 Tax=Solanum lycopersicum TaxID=4081 RepID=UPI000532AB69